MKGNYSCRSTIEAHQDPEYAERLEYIEIKDFGKSRAWPKVTTPTPAAV
jgi:hypothetical protein